MMKTVWGSRKKIIGLTAVLLLVLLMMNLNSRLSEYFRLSNERDKLSTQVAYSYATKVALDTQVAYATSDKAVEDWARDEARMSRPGDKVIVPVTPANETPQPIIEVTPTPTTIENWQVWWGLFFENR